MVPWLVLAAACCLASGGLVGVAPEDLGRYPTTGSGSFKCVDGSGEFPASAVNDDFCDCADGSDEPGTAACAGLPGAHFYCRNAGSVPKLLYASRVRDGICDCCDGSDEASGRCQDSCEAEGAQVRADRDRRRSALVDGLRILREAEDKAKASAASWREELEALDKELPALEAAEADAKARADEARKVADETRQKQVAEEVAQSGAALSEDFEGPAAEERWKRAVGGGFRIVDDPKGQRGKVLAMTSCTWGGDAFSVKDVSCTWKSKCKISFWARGAPWQGFSRGTQRTEEPGADAHSWLAVPAGNPDFPDRLVSTQSSDDWVPYEYEFPQQDAFQMLGDAEVTFSSGNIHIMVQAHGSTGRCGDTMFDDFRVWKDNVVMFVDADGDKVELKISDMGELSAYANDELMVQNIVDFSTDGLYLLFGGYRAAAPSQDVVRRAMLLWARRQAVNGNPPPDIPPAEADEAPGESKEEGSAAEEAPAAEAPKAPEISEYAKWALNQESGSEEAGSASSKDSDSDKAGDAPGNWNRISRPLSLDPDDVALRNATDGLEEAKRKLEEKKKQREDLDKKLKQVRENPRALALADACVEKHIQQYSYKICFTGEAKQDSVSLGTFKEWESGSASVLLFDNGQYCYGGPHRSLRVRLLCGPEGVLNDVSEPSRCSYEAEVVHPTACREEDLRALEEEVGSRILRPHEEL